MLLTGFQNLAECPRVVAKHQRSAAHRLRTIGLDCGKNLVFTFLNLQIFTRFDNHAQSYVRRISAEPACNGHLSPRRV